jgi:hypothetical protein
MKTFKVILIGILFTILPYVQAQVSVNVNIGTPPMWGPVGYPAVQYYYLPDVESYYDINNSMFIYYTGGNWVHRKYLPIQYRNYDLYGGYKVVMTNYHGNTPYTYFKDHKSKYAKGYHGPYQKTRGEKPVHNKIKSSEKPNHNTGKQNVNSKGGNEGNHNSPGKSNGKSHKSK